MKRPRAHNQLGEKAGDDLKERVLKALRATSVVRVALSNVASMNQLSDFIKSVRNIPLVRDCWLRSMTTAPRYRRRAPEG